MKKYTQIKAEWWCMWGLLYQSPSQAWARAFSDMGASVCSDVRVQVVQNMQARVLPGVVEQLYKSLEQ